MPTDNPNLRMHGTLPPAQYMLLHPDEFDPDKLTVNEIEQDNGLIIAKIPSIPGHITRRRKNDSDEYYIELVLSQHYDPETKQNRNKKVIIGTDVSYYLRGMMFANDNYHEYFNVRGEVLPQILDQWAEEERQKRKAALPEKTQAGEPAEESAKAPETQAAPKQPTPHNIPKNNQKPDTEAPILKAAEKPKEQEESAEPEEKGEASEVQLKELRQKEKALEAREKELDKREKELENRRMVSLIKTEKAIQDHIDLLRDVLIRHADIVEEQAKRRPDKPMSVCQIRTINELLQELRDLFLGSEIEDLLHLADEPKEGDTGPGTTYGEMALLLNAYESMLHSFAIGKLRTK